MRSTLLLTMLTAGLLTFTACEDKDGDTNDATDDGNNTSDVSDNPGNRVGDADGQLGPWFMSSHGCVGNRTDAMWFDDADNGFVSCGSTTSGYGLYETHDGGETWASTTASPNLLGEMRVNSISRGPDGLLYLGGTGPQGMRVVWLDDATGSMDGFYLKPSSGAQSWQTYQVGTFRMDDNGRAVSESLTGSDVMYWPDTTDTEGYVNGYGWWNECDGTIEGNGAQILDLETDGDSFYGVGSTINQPPYFFYEPAGGMGDAFAMEPVKLSGDGLSNFNGEAWDLSIDANGDMLIAGVNQATDTAVLWYSEGDVTTDAGWTMYDTTPIIPVFSTNSTRFYGGCRSGDLMVGLGDFSQESTALAVFSTDGGANWNLYGPPGTGADTVGPLSKCQIFGDDVYVTGADGFFGILDTDAVFGDLPAYTGTNEPPAGLWSAEVYDIEAGGVYAHDLDEGATLDLDWAADSSVACWVGTENQNFDGNHVFFGLEHPANTQLTVAISPDPGVDVSLYAMQMGGDDWIVPPVTGDYPLSCDASFDHVHDSNPGEVEYLHITGRDYDANVLIGVAGVDGATAGGFQVEVFTTDM